MKRIKIQNISPPDKTSVYTRNHYYSIFLASEKTIYFKNEVKAKQFLAETNRLYNSIMHEYNFIYIQLLTEYRTIWFYLDQNFKNDIPVKISDLEKVFDLVIVKSSHSVNGNPFTFQYLIKIYTILHDIALSLRSVMQEKDYYHKIQQIDIFINQLSDIFIKLNSWGKNYPGSVFDVK